MPGVHKANMISSRQLAIKKTFELWPYSKCMCDAVTVIRLRARGLNVATSLCIFADAEQVLTHFCMQLFKIHAAGRLWGSSSRTAS